MPTIRFKNGARIPVPDGVDPHAVAQAYLRDIRAKNADNIAKDQESYNPTNEMGTWERLKAGAGAGLLRPVRNAMDMFGMDSTVIGGADTDKALLNTTAGKVGDFVGNTAALTAATLPVGAALGAARSALPLATGGGRVAAALTGGAAENVIGGAVQGAINAEPGQRKEGALFGAATGGAVYGALKGASKLASMGITKYADDMTQLRDTYFNTPEDKFFVPLSNSARHGPVRSLYRVLGLVPGSAGKMEKQLTDAQGKILTKAGEIAMPQTALRALQQADPTFQMPKAGENPWAWAAQAQRGTDMVMDRVNGINYQVNEFVDRSGRVQPSNFPNLANTKNLWTRDSKLATSVHDAITEFQKSIQSSPMAPGHALQALRRQIKAIAGQHGGLDSQTGSKLRPVIERLDEFLRTKGSKASWDDAFQFLDEEFPAYSTVREAIAKAAGNTGRALPSQLMGSVGGSTSMRATGAAPLQEFAGLATRAVGDGLMMPGGAFKAGAETGIPWLGRVIGRGVSFTGIPSMLGAQSTQRALVGDLASQKALAAALKNNPNALSVLANVGTAAFVPEGE